jgi:enoyl-[acyl-carrier protein] reductase II
MNTAITKLFGVRLPIVQGGMVWCSGWKLASAVSNAGGLGLIGAGSMYPDVLREHIQKCKAATTFPFGVNVPLIYPDIEKHMNTIVEEGVKIVFTSAGNPATWTGWLKERGIVVVHVVPNVSLAKKAEARGVDAVVCEGFEAGGHNGKDELTTMVLVPQVRDAVQIPVIAAGGIGDGRGIAAALALGADGVQIGSRFAATVESSAHPAFKQAIVDAADNATMLTMRKTRPVRIIRNQLYEKLDALEFSGATPEQMFEALGRGRAKKGIFEGDLIEGELEIGQISGLIKDIPDVATLIKRLQREYQDAIAKLPSSL